MRTTFTPNCGELTLSFNDGTSRLRLVVTPERVCVFGSKDISREDATRASDAFMRLMKRGRQSRGAALAELGCIGERCCSVREFLTKLDCEKVLV